ncbi:hypothetical protein DRE_06657 [Drechslerella stenobrocha 248]|uniref:AB hydrolase-1 domain-containing protein n=1 Tax=Drechslerella stenobrocha 248 TaxID=1043628 RepID=W7HKR1_9PEZI|nr:hypothetical protein DRE_06657 [Drechslerella stenobrocha 248]
MMFGPATLRFHHHPSPVLLKPTSGSPSDNDAVPESIVSVCKSVVPPFYPHPFLRSGHLQTCAILLASDDVPIHYKRFILSADSPDDSDTGTFSIDVVVPPPSVPASDITATPSKKVLLETDPEYFPPRTSYFSDDEFAAWSSDSETNPLVVVLHGLSGGSHESYIRLALEPIVKPKKDGGLGYDALVVNARGCGWTKLTSNRMFNAMFTADLRQVIKMLRQRFPNRPLMGLGFSLGANILANYLGEESSSCPLHAAVLISSPHDIDACAKIMLMSFTGRQYSIFMANNLKKLYERNFDMLSTHPAVNPDDVRKSLYLFDYDHNCTAKAFGFRTGGEYYRAATSVDKLMEVKVPTLIINAEEDPISRQEAFPRNEAEANPYLCFVTTSIGGHIGWFEWGGKRWFPKPILGFLDRMAGLELVEKPGEAGGK